MYDELVKQLKEDKSWVEQGTTQTEHEIAEHIQQAADAIEELTGFVQEAERDRDEYRERLDKANDAIEELSKDRDSMNEANIALYGALPKWTPVTERLPKEEETVLAFGTLGVAWLDWRHDNKWCCYGGVTHWMPLPQPPKGEEE